MKLTWRAIFAGWAPFLFLFLFLFSPSVHAQPPEQSWLMDSPCTYLQLVTAPTGLGAIRQIITWMQDDETANPFVNACQNPEDLKGRPLTALYKRDAPLQDRLGRPSSIFLKRVADRVRDKIGTNEAMLDALEICLTTGSKDFASKECTEVRTITETRIKTALKDARYNLALAQTSRQLRTMLNSADVQVNAKLENLGTYKLNDWEPLTPDELKQASDALESYKTEIAKHYDDLVKEGKLPPPIQTKVKGKSYFRDDPKTAEAKNASLLVTRFQHGKDYQDIMAEFPVFQYLTKSEPSNDDIVAAVKEMRKRLGTERGLLNKSEKAALETKFNVRGRGGVVLKDGPRTSLNPDALNLLDYRSIVEEELLKTPEYCGLAATLQHTKENRTMSTNLALGLPIMAVGFVVSPVISIPLGIAAGVGFALDSKQDLEHVKTQFLSQVFADPELGELGEVSEANRNYNINLATMPLAFGGSQALLSKAGIKWGSAKVAAAVINKASASRTSPTMLREASTRLEEAAKKIRSRNGS